VYINLFINIPYILESNPH